MEGDTEKTRSAGADILFTPTSSGIYPEGFKTYVSVEVLSEIMCGKTRPGHFSGVSTVVLKLLNIVKPHIAFFGQKDFQQTVIIKRMVKDLNVDVNIIVLPTIRETDGLAMSSRNQYLDKEERRAATILYRALKKGNHYLKAVIRVREKLREIISHSFQEEPSAHLEYLAIVHPETLEEEKEVCKGTLIAIAAHIGKTRLIDNIIL